MSDVAPFTVARPIRAMAVTARIGAAAVGIGALALITVWSKAMIDTYVYHLCGWPAEISCDGPVRIWWSVPLWFAIMALAGAGAHSPGPGAADTPSLDGRSPFPEQRRWVNRLSSAAGGVVGLVTVLVPYLLSTIWGK